jgi:hypothetical protein
MVKGRSFGDSFALPYLGTVWTLSPRCWTEPGLSQWGRLASKTNKSRVHRFAPAHPPVAAISLSGSALGWFPAVAPIAPRASREPLYSGGGQVLKKLYPEKTADVQLCAVRGTSWHRISARLTNTVSRCFLFHIFAAQRTLSNSTYCGFSHL